eukprot:SAG25_NODE_10693_length_325_cov_0.907080_1_plen_24_part_01
MERFRMCAAAAAAAAVGGRLPETP